MKTPSPKSTRKPVIGILGGIGAGKSTVASEFAALGCALVDGDAIGHELLATAEVKDLLRQRWDDEIFGGGGRVDRAALGDIVFGSPDEMKALNGIMHPRIRRLIQQRISDAMTDDNVKGVVLDAAVALEAGWDDLCTHLVFVDAPRGLRAARSGALRGWDRHAWRMREKSQIPLDTKAARCYYTLDNSSSVSFLREQIRELFSEIVSVSD